jgi:hypothetical protein
MRPGKNPTPRSRLDLKALWRMLKEEPPGRVQTLAPSAAGNPVPKPAAGSAR